MKKSLVLLILSLALILPNYSQIQTLKNPKLTLAKPKIKVSGFAAYYGNAKYISASLTLEMNGKPLKNVKVRINRSLLNNQGDGSYNGSIPSTYNLKLGNKLVFTAEFPKQQFRVVGSPPPYEGKVILGWYRISDIVKWVYPKPGQTLTTGRFLTYLFKWDFTGRAEPTEIFVKDKQTNNKVFSKVLSTEQHHIMAKLLKPGKSYIMGIWASSPLNQFRLSRHCAPGSKIDWFFSDMMEFKVAGLRIKAAPIREIR